MPADKVKMFHKRLVLETTVAGCRLGWAKPVLFPTSSSAQVWPSSPDRDSAPSQEEQQPRGFHSKSRQNLLWKYWNPLTMGLTCQLSFHHLICASKECLGKSFKLQFTSEHCLAQSLGLRDCFVLLSIDRARKEMRCLDSDNQNEHGRGVQGHPWALCPCWEEDFWVVLLRHISQPATCPYRDGDQQFRYYFV